MYGIPEVFEKIKLNIAYSFAAVRSDYLWYLGYIIILYAVKRIRMIYSGKEQFNKRELQGYSKHIATFATFKIILYYLEMNMENHT